jgi:hypothetical protein
LYDVPVRGWLIVSPALLVCAAFFFSCGSEESPAPSVPAIAGFVGSETCKTCHEDRHESWLETAHAYSLRDPTEDVVEGRFDGKPVETPRFVATPYRRDGRWFIKVEGKDGRPDGNHEVTRVVGRLFEQAYLTTDHRGRWPILPICWSIERGEWDVTHEVLEDISGHQGAISDDYDTRRQAFNHGCGQCHATDFDVGHNTQTGSLDSKMLEGAVACESCHGPGSVHAEFHLAAEGATASDTLAEEAARLLHPKKDLGRAKEVLHSCGRCHYTHKWMYAIDSDPRVGHEQIAVSLHFDRPGFYADGRLAGLNYHGTTQSQSACFLEGDMSCLSCHRMHGGKRFSMKWEGNSNRQCTQCHDENEYQAEAHTHHSAEAASCVDCHMPMFLTGVLHFVRDHSIRSPDPALTEKFGAANVPNACNECHKDQSAGWAREARDKWWGAGDAKMASNVAMVLRIRAGADKVQMADLIAMAEDTSNTTFFRMTALQAMLRDPVRWNRPKPMEAIQRLLGGQHVEMLQILCTALGAYPVQATTPGLLSLLDHENRPVRVLAGFAAIRAGWRGGHGADKQFVALYEDAKEMLVRQNHTVERLETVGYFADVVGTAEEMNDCYARILRLASAVPGEWRPAVVELLHRRARKATESGKHATALALYNDVRSASAGKPPVLLHLDAADSMSATGSSGPAQTSWRHVIAVTRKGSVFYELAQARLTGRSDGLKRWEANLSADPAGGELLQRVRWALKALK